MCKEHVVTIAQVEIKQAVIVDVLLVNHAATQLVLVSHPRRIPRVAGLVVELLDLLPVVVGAREGRGRLRRVLDHPDLVHVLTIRVASTPTTSKLSNTDFMALCCSVGVNAWMAVKLHSSMLRIHGYRTRPNIPTHMRACARAVRLANAPPTRPSPQ